MSVTPPQGDQQSPDQPDTRSPQRTTPTRDGGPSEPEGPDGSKPGRRRRAVDLEPETFRGYARFTGWLVLALVVSYIGLQLPLPYRLLAVVAGLAGVVGAVVLLVQCIRRRLPTLIYVSAVATLLACGIFATTAAAQTLFWGATAEFDQCRSQALTERSMAQCYADYEESMLSMIPGMP